MLRGNGKAAALLEGVVPGILAWARRGVLRRASPSSDPAPGARGKPLPAEVLERFRLPPDAEERLRAIGMPADDSPIFAGPRRRADTPELAAAKLVIWARAINATGDYPSAVVCAFYGECAAADHRVAVGDNRLLFALKHTQGVRCRRDPARRGGYIWTIEAEPQPELQEEAGAGSSPVASEAPAPIPAPVATEPAATVCDAPARPEPVGCEAAGLAELEPRAAPALPAPAVPAPVERTAAAVPARPAMPKRAVEAPLPLGPPRPIAKPPLNRPRLLHRFVGDQDEMWPQLVQARAREARRLGRARKQRGGRASRRAV